METKVEQLNQEIVDREKILERENAEAAVMKDQI